MQNSESEGTSTPPRIGCVMEDVLSVAEGLIDSLNQSAAQHQPRSTQPSNDAPQSAAPQSAESFIDSIEAAPCSIQVLSSPSAPSGCAQAQVFAQGLRSENQLLREQVCTWTNGALTCCSGAAAAHTRKRRQGRSAQDERYSRGGARWVQTADGCAAREGTHGGGGEGCCRRGRWGS